MTTPTRTRKFEVSVNISDTFTLNAKLCDLLGCGLADLDEDVIAALEAYIEENIADFVSDNFTGADITPLKPEDDPDATDTTDSTE